MENLKIHTNGQNVEKNLNSETYNYLIYQDVMKTYTVTARTGHFQTEVLLSTVEVLAG
jgi:hypothetical protein